MVYPCLWHEAGQYRGLTHGLKSFLGASHLASRAISSLSCPTQVVPVGRKCIERAELGVLSGQVLFCGLSPLGSPCPGLELPQKEGLLFRAS